MRRTMRVYQWTSNQAHYDEALHAWCSRTWNCSSEARRLMRLLEVHLSIVIASFVSRTASRILAVRGFELFRILSSIKEYRSFSNKCLWKGNLSRATSGWQNSVSPTMLRSGASMCTQVLWQQSRPWRSMCCRQTRTALLPMPEHIVLVFPHWGNNESG